MSNATTSLSASPRAPPSQDAAFFTALIPSYDEFAYPVNPIITSFEILESIRLMREDPGHAALVFAFAAVTINLTETSWTQHGDISARIQDLMARSVAAKQQACVVDVKSIAMAVVRRAMTCIFLEICNLAYKRCEQGYLLLQEAISHIHILRIDRAKVTHAPAAYSTGFSPMVDDAISPPELARRQRLYWEAFVHERFLTVVSGLPATMPPLRTGLPDGDASIPAHVDKGWTRLVRLFSILDEEFLAYWRSQDLPEEERPFMTALYIERKQVQLDEDEAEMEGAATADSPLSELQLADLFVTRLWQRILIWQLGMSRCLLSSIPPASSHEGMSLVFPARRLSAQLRSLVTQLNAITSIGAHGSGILEKLFEITNTIADVLALVPDAARACDGQTVEDFIFVARVLFSFERIDTVQRDILRMKIQSMSDAFIGVHAENPNFDHPGREKELKELIESVHMS